MKLSDLDFSLPEELIAQQPLSSRESARMMVLGREGGEIHHASVRELPSMLRPSLFVFNDTRVVPARLFCKRPSGGAAELLLIRRIEQVDENTARYLAWGKPSKALAPDVVLGCEGEITALIESRNDEGVLSVMLSAAQPLDEAIRSHAHLALPPYIKRLDNAADVERYQTVFARNPGAIAAPTAGLHFSDALLESLKRAGHEIATVTLHVGPGTFAPVRVEHLEEHSMHSEAYEVSEDAAAAINLAKQEGKPVVSVGTTVTRVLETLAQEGGVRACLGETSIFIYPPFDFKIIDVLFTNFHTPKSTLVALVMAWAGEAAVRRAYADAVAEQYRFFSYGDAMLIPKGIAMRHEV